MADTADREASKLRLLLMAADGQTEPFPNGPRHPGACILSEVWLDAIRLFPPKLESETQCYGLAKDDGQQ